MHGMRTDHGNPMQCYAGFGVFYHQCATGVDHDPSGIQIGSRWRDVCHVRYDLCILAPEGQTIKSMRRICVYRLFPGHLSYPTNEIQTSGSIVPARHRDPLRGASAGAQHGDAYEDGVFV